MDSTTPAAPVPHLFAVYSREPDRGSRPASSLRVVRKGGRTEGPAPDAGAPDDGGGDRGRSRGGRGDENFFKAVWRSMQEDDVFSIAGGMAYFAFLALPPSILVLFALTGFFGGEAAANWITQQLTALMPEDAAGWIDTFVQNIVHTQAPGPFSIGIVLALWAASNVFMAVTRALNIAYGIDEGRSFVRQRALALGVLVLFVVFFLTGSAALIMGPQIAAAVQLFGIVDTAWSVLQWVLPFLLIIGAFWMAYYILPARDQKRHNREILIGALVAAGIWILATIGFRFYVANFGSYNETYGVLGGVILLMLWLYLTMLVILIGGQFAAELERRAAL